MPHSEHTSVTPPRSDVRGRDENNLFKNDVLFKQNVLFIYISKSIYLKVDLFITK